MRGLKNEKRMGELRELPGQLLCYANKNGILYKNNASLVNAIRRLGSRFIHQGFDPSDCAYESFCAGVSKVKFAPKPNHKLFILGIRYYHDLSTEKHVSVFPSLKIKVIFFVTYQFYQYFIFIKQWCASFGFFFF